MAGSWTLGDEVEDSVTGFRGTAIAVTEYFQGERRVGIQPRAVEYGKYPEAQWFDAGRVRKYVPAGVGG